MNGRDGHGSPRVTREVLRAGRRALLSTALALTLGLLAASVALGVFASGAFAWGSAQGPPAGPTTRPFTQCPAIGRDASCGYLIDVTTQNGSLVTSVIKDPKVGFFDGEDDVSVGVQNDTSGSLKNVHVGFAKSGEKLFAFDGDGLCSEKVHPKPEQCPFGPGLVDPIDYYGPDTSYENLEGTEGGTISFSVALAPGQYTYFSLEAGSTKTVVAGSVDDVVSTLLTDTQTAAKGTTVFSETVVPMTDQATIQGPFAAEASGTVEYLLYDQSSGCKGAAIENLGKKLVSGGQAEPSNPSGQALAPNHTYYWVARYSGDGHNNGPSESTCGGETMTFGKPPAPRAKVVTMLSGGGQEGTQISVVEGTAVTATALITAEHQPVSGRLSYAAFASPTCALGEIVGLGSGGTTTGFGPSSNPVTLPPGKYYFQAFYSGSETLEGAFTPCGATVLTVLARQSTTGAAKGGGSSGSTPPPAPPSGQFTLDGLRVNEKNGQIWLTAQFPAAGTAVAVAMVRHGASLARTVRVGAAARTRCRQGFVAVRRRCVSDAPVQYGATSLAPTAPGIYTFVIKPRRRAWQALRAGRALYVTVSVTFQNRLGGMPATHSRSVLVKLRLPSPRRHKH